MPMRKLPSSYFLNCNSFSIRVNDRTVPFVTAAIETEDPFAEHAFNGVDMFVFSSYLVFPFLT